MSLFVKSILIEVIFFINVNDVKVDIGNWIIIEFNVFVIDISLKGNNKLLVIKNLFGFVGNNFFYFDVIVGGFIGCMRDFKINNNGFKLVKGVDIVKNVEFDKCNIIDFCVFVFCLNNVKCIIDGKELICNCLGIGYKGEVC